jgi:hypothetical protein
VGTKHEKKAEKRIFTIPWVENKLLKVLLADLCERKTLLAD